MAKKKNIQYIASIIKSQYELIHNAFYVANL